jgi:hypothetical protein
VAKWHLIASQSISKFVKAGSVLHWREAVQEKSGWLALGVAAERRH